MGGISASDVDNATGEGKLVPAVVPAVVLHSRAHCMRCCCSCHRDCELRRSTRHSADGGRVSCVLRRLRGCGQQSVLVATAFRLTLTAAADGVTRSCDCKDNDPTDSLFMYLCKCDLRSSSASASASTSTPRQSLGLPHRSATGSVAPRSLSNNGRMETLAIGVLTVLVGDQGKPARAPSPLR